jgi:hypothetical protein
VGQKGKRTSKIKPIVHLEASTAVWRPNSEGPRTSSFLLQGCQGTTPARKGSPQISVCRTIFAIVFSSKTRVSRVPDVTAQFPQRALQNGQCSLRGKLSRGIDSLSYKYLSP